MKRITNKMKAEHVGLTTEQAYINRRNNWVEVTYQGKKMLVNPLYMMPTEKDIIKEIQNEIK